MSIQVLVVDDVATMRRLYRMYFEDTGLDVEVIEAASGEAALQVLDDRHVDVVLTDHRMGAVSGIDVLVHALRQQPDALRCMMTGYADPDLAAMARRKAKAQIFMEKGMGIADVTKALEAKLGARLRAASASASGQ